MSQATVLDLKTPNLMRDLITSVNLQLAWLGFRAVKHEEVQPGLRMIRVEIHRFYHRETHEFRTDSFGVFECVVKRVNSDDGIVELEVEKDTIESIYTDLINLTLNYVERDQEKNDIRYYTKDAGHCV